MKKNFFLFLILTLLLTTFINAKEIKSVVKIKSKTIKSKPQVKPEIKSIIKIKPEINYNENIKYEKIPEYKLEEKETKNKFDFGSFSPFDSSLRRSRLEERQIIQTPIIIKTKKKTKKRMASNKIAVGLMTRLK